jgi:hypothetical protein
MKEKWKAGTLSVDEISVMEELFVKRFKDGIKSGETIQYSGYYTDKVLYMNVLLKNADDSYFYPIETYISVDDNPDIGIAEAKLVLLDFIDSYFEDYLGNNRDTLIPIDWAAFTVKGRKVFARGQVLNKKLEREADLLLESAGYDSNGDSVKKG